MVEPLLQADDTRPREPRALLGYAMVLTAGTLWAVNGIVSKVILESGLSALRLREVRSTGAIVLGTIVPFGLLVGSLRYVSATRASITAMIEPVAVTLVAWLWLDEALDLAQLGGGALLLAGIALAQTAR